MNVYGLRRRLERTAQRDRTYFQTVVTIGMSEKEAEAAIDQAQREAAAVGCKYLVVVDK